MIKIKRFYFIIEISVQGPHFLTDLLLKKKDLINLNIGFSIYDFQE